MNEKKKRKKKLKSLFLEYGVLQKISKIV